MVRLPCGRSRLRRRPDIITVRGFRSRDRLPPAGSAIGQAASAHAGKGFCGAGRPGMAHAREGTLPLVDPGLHERDRVVAAEMVAVNDCDRAGAVSGKPIEESSGTVMKAPVLGAESYPVPSFGAFD